MFLEVQLDGLGVSQLLLLGAHGKRGQRYGVLQFIEVIEGVLDVALDILDVVFLRGVVLVDCLLALVNHDQAADVVGDALNLRDAPIRLLDQVEVLVDILELRRDYCVLRD